MANTPANALNITAAGIVKFDGTSTFSADTVTQHDVLVGGASNAITSVAPSATSGVPLVSAGSTSDPTFGTAVVAGGGTGDTSFTTYAPVCGGTSTTGALQSASTGMSNSGYVLTSTGASSLPTWQAGGGGGGITTIDGNSGSITGSTVTINGGTTGLTTSGATATMSLTGVLVGANGGTGVANTGLTIDLSSGSTGYVLTSDSSGNGTWQAGGGGSVTINVDASGSVSGSTLSLLATPGDGSANAGGSIAFIAASGTEIDLQTTDSSQSILIGAQTPVNTATASCIMGFQACKNTGGNNSVIIGYQANASGSGQSNGCIFIGANAAELASAQAFSVAIGMYSMRNGGTGPYNTCVGYSTGTGFTGGEGNNVCLNSQGQSGDQNTIRIMDQSAYGGTASSCYIGGIYESTISDSAVFVTSQDQLGIVASSARFKDNIQDINTVSSSLMKLRPVSFNWKDPKNAKITQYGLIAEEVEKIYPELCNYDKEGKVFNVKYHYLPVMLLNEIQKLRKELDELKAKVGQ